VTVRAGRHGAVPDIMVDFLTGLLHLCKGLKLDFDDLAQRAALHFAAEDVDD
jgi:hypothetical protein